MPRVRLKLRGRCSRSWSICLSQLDKRIAFFDREIVRRAKEYEAAQRSMTILGIGPIAAAAIIAIAPLVETFRKAATSSPGSDLRRASIPTTANRNAAAPGKWRAHHPAAAPYRWRLDGPPHMPPQCAGWFVDGANAGAQARMLVSVALASKMARKAWALLTYNEDYRAPAAVVG